MDKIEQAIKSLPKGIPAFLLSFAPMGINKQIAFELKKHRPLCILIAVGAFPIEDISQLHDSQLYEERVDDNIIIHNTQPNQFIDTYGKTCSTKFARIFVDQDYKNLSKMMLKNGKIINI